MLKASTLKQSCDVKDMVVIYPYDENGNLMKTLRLISSSPYAYALSAQNQSPLNERDRGKRKYKAWYAYGRNVSIVPGFKCKILTSGITSSLIFRR